MSARLFGALCADLPGLNLAELNNGLKTMCAAAYSQHPQEPVIVLKAMDLPPELLGRLSLSQIRKPSESTPLPIEQFRRQDGSDQILKLFDHLLESHRHYYNEHRVFAQFLEQGLTRMREYYDTIIFSTKEVDSRLVVIEAQIRRELETLDLDQRLTLPAELQLCAGPDDVRTGANSFQSGRLGKSAAGSDSGLPEHLASAASGGNGVSRVAD